MTAKPYLDAYARRPLQLRPSVVRLFDPIELKDHILTHHAGQTVLVVGHSNTIPELIRQLGGTSLPNIDDCEFDNLFVLVRYRSSEASLTKLKYGAPTSAPC
jgi:bisphosphoglycerate-dependent phosphoglycerate mutase